MFRIFRQFTTNNVSIARLNVHAKKKLISFAKLRKKIIVEIREEKVAYYCILNEHVNVCILCYFSVLARNRINVNDRTVLLFEKRFSYILKVEIVFTGFCITLVWRIIYHKNVIEPLHLRYWFSIFQVETEFVRLEM